MTVPHDPVGDMQSGCPICKAPWPCPERLRQRAERRAARALLLDDLYATVGRPHVDVDGTECVSWTNAGLGITVDLGYDREGLCIRVAQGDTELGRTHAGTASWLQGMLP